MPAYFVTGTDTGVGKTLFTVALLACIKHRGIDCVGLKPIAAGCDATPDGLRSDDALRLQAVSNPTLDYDAINPVALQEPIAPHIAAAKSGISLRARALAEYCRPHLIPDPGFTVIEGAGGWHVPLNDEETLADLAKMLGVRVILVVGMRLGCLNHALLTAQAIRMDGLELAGWVANSCADAMPREDENFQALERRLEAPCIARVPWLGQNPALDRILPLIGFDKLVASGH